ncbi:MAG: hypothetical protein KDB98_05530 [Flavobacteriales bacterium]|nr:hypothetical protein [Flavobacteriales bacterium]
MHLRQVQLLFSTLIIVVILSSNLFAQESNKYYRLKGKWNRLEGYVIDKDSVKIEGLITWVAKNSANRFNEVKFVDKTGKSKTYYPETIKGFGYDTLEYISDGNVFFEVVLKGARLNLYRNVTIFQSWLDPHEKYLIPNRDTTSEVLIGKLVTDPTSPLAYPPYYGPTINRANDFYLQKVGHSKIKYVDPAEFNAKFAEYFYDCPTLSSRISQKLLNIKDLLQIIKIYNQECIP